MCRYVGMKGNLILLQGKLILLQCVHVCMHAREPYTLKMCIRKLYIVLLNIQKLILLNVRMQGKLILLIVRTETYTLKCMYAEETNTLKMYRNLYS